MMASTLFTTDLAGPCTAARKAWKLTENETVDWLAVIVPCAAAKVRQALRGKDRVALLIVNTPQETVVGGDRQAVLALVQEAWRSLRAACRCQHCPLHHCQGSGTGVWGTPRFTDHGSAGNRLLQRPWGRSYPLNRENAAAAILAQVLTPIDFPALIDRSYQDGVRVFLEIGPGGSCSRMIRQILGNRPHLARSACLPGLDGFSTVVRLLGNLIAKHMRVDLSKLYGQLSGDVAHGSKAADAGKTTSRSVKVLVGGKPFEIPKPPVVDKVARRQEKPAFEHAEMSLVAPSLTVTNASVRAEGRNTIAPLIQQLTAAETAKAQAHEVYLRFAANLTNALAGQLGSQLAHLANRSQMVTRF